MINEFLAYFEPTVGNPFCMAPVFIFLIMASFIDIKKMQIPDTLNLVFLGIRIILGASVYPFTLDHLYGAAAGFLLICIPAMILLWKMGGDIKMSAVLGSWIGVGGILLSTAAGLFFFILVALIKKMKRREPMAWAPFVSMGVATLLLTYLVFRYL